MSRESGTQLLETLVDELTLRQQDELLRGYVDAVSEGERQVALDPTERQKAIDLMLDNAGDCSETRAGHIGFCLQQLIAE